MNSGGDHNGPSHTSIAHFLSELAILYNPILDRRQVCIFYLSYSCGWFYHLYSLWVHTVSIKVNILKALKILPNFINLDTNMSSWHECWPTAPTWEPPVPCQWTRLKDQRLHLFFHMAT